MNKIIVENDTMRFYSTPVPIPVGGSQWSKIFFMFSDEWEDLRKIAQFRQGELKRNVDIDSNNFCYVPNEMLPDMCGELSIVGYPQDTASAVIATANSLMLNFVQGFESGGEPAVPPTPDLYQKLIKEFAESGGGNPDAVLYSKQELTAEQQEQARTNIGALDVNIKTTPVDIGVGLGSTVYYVQSGWLRPCPDNADKELKLQYRRVFEFIGSQRLCPSSQNILLEAKSAYALYQKGLASESIVVTNNPLRAAQVYVTWNITTRSNKHYFYYAQVSMAYYYDCTYCVEDDALTSERYQSPVYRTAYGVGEQDSVSQFRMSVNPTEDMHIATKQYVDTAKTEAQQLGLTAATPGQIIKVKAVQDGKPTEWEAVDMPSGDEWELIAHINVADDVEKDVTVWQYNNLPRYKCVAYKKVNLVGSSEQTYSGCYIEINNESSQPSGMTYGKLGSPYSCIGIICVMPFGWTHWKTGDAISPDNVAFGGVSAMYGALPLSDNAITSIKLSAHPVYKIASGEIWLYGKRG